MILPGGSARLSGRRLSRRRREFYSEANLRACGIDLLRSMNFDSGETMNAFT